MLNDFSGAKTSSKKAPPTIEMTRETPPIDPDPKYYVVQREGRRVPISSDSLNNSKAQIPQNFKKPSYESPTKKYKISDNLTPVGRSENKPGMS